MKRLIVAAALACAGCASSDGSEGWTATTNAQRIPWENNTSAWLITCASADQAGCYARAGAICPGGYARLNEGPAARNIALTIRCN